MASASTAGPLRRLLPWLGLAGVAGLLALQADRLTDPAALGLHDYVAYWSAGRLNALGQDPYSPAGLLALQRTVGWADDWPNIMYYPPWALALVMPFALLPYGASRLLWLLAHLAVVLFGADRAWRLYGGPERHRWVAWALSFAFVPTLIALRMGQIGPVILLGVVGFLWLERRQRDALAGAALILAAVKPQLVYLFGIAVLCWAVDRRRWGVLAGGVAAGVAATAVAVACNPAVLAEYRYALANPPSGNISPTIGAVLRLVFDKDQVWLQFVPTAIGLAWFPFYWRKHRQNWDWRQQAPVLLMVSFITTAYGAWVFDLVVLLLPILQAACWVVASRERRMAALAGGLFAAITGTALLLNLGAATYPAFIWMTPAVLLSYWLLGGFSAPRRCAVAANA